MVDLAANEPPTVLPRGLIALRFPILDGAGNPAWLLRLAIESLASLLRAGIPTLVHCSAGMSRTPAVAAAALTLAHAMSPADALRLVTRAGPADISPALWADLQVAIAGKSPSAPIIV